MESTRVPGALPPQLDGFPVESTQVPGALPPLSGSFTHDVFIMFIADVSRSGRGAEQEREAEMGLGEAEPGGNNGGPQYSQTIFHEQPALTASPWTPRHANNQSGAHCSRSNSFKYSPGRVIGQGPHQLSHQGSRPVEAVLVPVLGALPPQEPALRLFPLLLIRRPRPPGAP